MPYFSGGSKTGITGGGYFVAKTSGPVGTVCWWEDSAVIESRNALYGVLISSPQLEAIEEHLTGSIVMTDRSLHNEAPDRPFVAINDANTETRGSAPVARNVLPVSIGSAR